MLYFKISKPNDCNYLRLPQPKSKMWTSDCCTFKRLALFSCWWKFCHFYKNIYPGNPSRPPGPSTYCIEYYLSSLVKGKLLKLKSCVAGMTKL